MTTPCYIGLKEGKLITYEEYDNWVDAYNDYMERYETYPKGHMWITEIIPDTQKVKNYD